MSFRHGHGMLPNVKMQQEPIYFTTVTQRNVKPLGTIELASTSSVSVYFDSDKFLYTHMRTLYALLGRRWGVYEMGSV